MQTKPELKIIADHLRSSCFLIADGVLPSNEGRGYVLRRIMRRAMRQIHKLGATEAMMFKLVDILIKEMGAAYPELARARDTIIDALKNEEEKFRETLEKGLKILEEEISRIKRTEEIGGIEYTKLWEGIDGTFGSTPLHGSIAFKLYDTYGFPLDLTQDILKEKNLEVDTDNFYREMELQRERARKNWSGSGEEKEDNLFFELKEKFGETKFLGYEKLESPAKILFISEAPNAFVILDQTSFYATSGGQKGDDGKIICGDNIFTISEARKAAGNLFLHLILETKGTFKIGDAVTTQVNKESRKTRAANHSATHLMHKTLKEVLGNSISQKGSNVDAEYFTFDFNFNRAMTAEEIKKVEDLVNSKIKENNSVNTNLMALDAARKSGAEALFGEKYDAEVRVVKMGNSVELCGGTHVKNTSEIEAFKIISEKSVASGIRRIEAKSGAGVKKYLSEQAEKQKEFSSKQIGEINKKDLEISNLGGGASDNSHFGVTDPKILEEILKKKIKEIERLKRQVLLGALNNLKSEKVGDITLVTHTFEDADAKDVREILMDAKAKKEFLSQSVFAFFGNKDDKVAVCVSIGADLLEKFDSAKLIAPLVEAVGGKGGGGKKDLAMGGGVNKDGIAQAIEAIKNLIK